MAVRWTGWLAALVFVWGMGPLRAAELAADDVRDLLGTTWTASVAKEPRSRTMRILSVQGRGDAAMLLSVRWGYSDQRGSLTTAEVRLDQGMRRLRLTTGADSAVDALESSSGYFVGTFVPVSGKVKTLTLVRVDETTAGSRQVAQPTAPAVASTAVEPGAQRASGDVLVVWMGGNDCPPCRAWRGVDFPRLQAGPEFPSIQFAFVIKSAGASVPPTTFLPESVKPYKQALDEASGGGPGSPQVAILVDGKVHDYFFGAPAVADLEAKLRSIRMGTAYPVPRCARMSPYGRSCDVWFPKS